MTLHFCRTILYIALIVTLTLSSVSKGFEPNVSEVERRAWLVRDQSTATSRAGAILGLAPTDPSKIEAQLLTVEDDNTPFLSAEVKGRVLWHVVFKDLQIKPPSAASLPAPYNAFQGTFDLFVDPKDGKVLRIKSRWPVEVPNVLPEPTAEIASQQLRRSGNERYHAFGTNRPPLTFFEAVDCLARDGVNVLTAKQLVGEWVLWSSMGKEPREVWAITLRGIPPEGSAAIEAKPGDIRWIMRYIVDPIDRRWLCATNNPHPEILPELPKELTDSQEIGGEE